MVKELNESVEGSTKELGKKSKEYIIKQYEEKLESDNSGKYENRLGEHIANIKLRAYNHRFKKGFILSSGDDDVIVYNEFGTGIVGEGTNPLASDAGYQYNVDSPLKGKVPKKAISDYAKKNGISYSDAKSYLTSITTSNTWWYWKKGSWRHTEGMSGKNMYSSLVDELKEVAVRDLKAKVKQTIGNYKGGKK